MIRTTAQLLPELEKQKLSTDAPLSTKSHIPLPSLCFLQGTLAMHSTPYSLDGNKTLHTDRKQQDIRQCDGVGFGFVVLAVARWCWL